MPVLSFAEIYSHSHQKYNGRSHQKFRAGIGRTILIRRRPESSLSQTRPKNRLIKLLKDKFQTRTIVPSFTPISIDFTAMHQKSESKWHSLFSLSLCGGEAAIIPDYHGIRPVAIPCVGSDEHRNTFISGKVSGRLFGVRSD